MAAIRIILLWLCVMYSTMHIGYTQVLGLQQENCPTLLSGQAGLPAKSLGYANQWCGYATQDTLAVLNLGGSAGFGLSNGSAFDLGISVRFNKLSLSAWSSGLTVRQDQPQPTASTLQRSSRFGANYRFRGFAVFAGAQVNYLAFNALSTVTHIAPVLSVATRLGSSQIGVRIQNPTFFLAQSEGVVGRIEDSTLVNREVKSGIKAPTQILFYEDYSYMAGKFSFNPVLGVGLNFNTPKEYQVFGSTSAGITLLPNLRVGYKNKFFVNAAYRPAHESKLSQLTFGLMLKANQVVFSYSSYNFYHFSAYRVHLLGLAISVK